MKTKKYKNILLLNFNKIFLISLLNQQCYLSDYYKNSKNLTLNFCTNLSTSNL